MEGCRRQRLSGHTQQDCTDACSSVQHMRCHPARHWEGQVHLPFRARHTLRLHTLSTRTRADSGRERVMNIAVDRSK